MEKRLVLVVLPNFRARSISVLQEHLLFEEKKMTLGWADAQGVPGGKASRWCSRMEPRQGCSWVSPCIRDPQPPCALPESHRQTHRSFLSRGRNCPVQAHQKRTTKFNHSASFTGFYLFFFFKLGSLFSWWETSKSPLHPGNDAAYRAVNFFHG